MIPLFLLYPLSFAHYPLLPASNHPWQTFHATNDVDVQVMYLLAAYSSGIDYRTKTIRTTLFPCQSGYQHHHFTEQSAMSIFHIGERVDVQFGYQHEMYRRRGMDIMECINVGILIHFLA